MAVTPANPFDPEQSRKQLLDGVQGITDPALRSTGPGVYTPPEIINDPGHLAPDPLPAAAGAAAPLDAAAMWDDLASKAGIKDAGAGSGFADRAYWLAHPSEILNGRYGADVAGTGTDQPTGTPGSGPWQNSGRADRLKTAQPAGVPGPQVMAAPTPNPLALPAVAAPSGEAGASSSDAALEALQAQMNRELMLQGLQQ